MPVEHQRELAGSGPIGEEVLVRRAVLGVVNDVIAVHDRIAFEHAEPDDVGPMPAEEAAMTVDRGCRA